MFLCINTYNINSGVSKHFIFTTLYVNCMCWFYMYFDYVSLQTAIITETRRTVHVDGLFVTVHKLCALISVQG